MGESGSFVLMACANDHSIIDKVLLINPGDLIELSKIPTKRTKLKQHCINMPVVGTFLYNLRFNKRTIEKDLHLNGYYDFKKIDTNTVKTFLKLHIQTILPENICIPASNLALQMQM